MDVLELTGYLITLLIGVVALITLVVKLIGRSSEREGKAREALEKELRADIKQANDRANARQFRIVKLEEQRTADLAQINELTTQVNTLLGQMRDMQNSAKKSELREQEKDEEIARLKKESARANKQAEDLFDNNQALMAQHVIWEKVIDKLAPEKSNTTEPNAPVIVAGASGIEKE